MELKRYALRRNRADSVSSRASLSSPTPPQRKPRRDPSSSESEDDDVLLVEAAVEVQTAASESSSAPVGLQDVPPGPQGPPVPAKRPRLAPQWPPAPPHEGQQQEACADLYLPQSWKKTLPSEQQEWLSRALFTRSPAGRPVLQKDLRLWYYPPGPSLSPARPPASPGPFFQRPFFLWMPYRMFGPKIPCPSCGHKLTGAGLYRTVRQVLSSDGWYHMGTEYLECLGCKRKLAAWCADVLEQLGARYQLMFPAVLTYKLCCDKVLLAQMSGRTLGNGVCRLQNFLLEQHRSAWMNRALSFLMIHKRFKVPGAVLAPPPPLPPLTPVPSRKWLLSVYAMEVNSRKPELLAKVTSVFGEILKMVSTKKITKKLADSASWCTSVGNECGQILVSVLMEEGQTLERMADGLMRRYSDAGVAPPQVLYVDRGCCASEGRTAVKNLFGEWDHLEIRLDIWHFIRRFSKGVTTESHSLYAPFMRRLSHAVFKWSQEDVSRLKEAKEAEEPGSWRRVSVKELARHCRRCTRGARETELAIEETLKLYWDAKETTGIPLIDQARMEQVWETQRRHTACIQDTLGVELYTQTGQITKGGVVLPIYRCARGTASLKSFHLHLNRFIPGTRVCAAYYSLYLLEGLVRWNQDRGPEAPRASDAGLRCSSQRQQEVFNQLTQEVYGRELAEHCREEREYTGELIGIDYLLAQSLLDQDLGDPDVPDGLQLAEEEVEEESQCDDDGFGEELPYNMEHLPSDSSDTEAEPPAGPPGPAGP